MFRYNKQHNTQVNNRLIKITAIIFVCFVFFVRCDDDFIYENDSTEERETCTLDESIAITKDMIRFGHPSKENVTYYGDGEWFLHEQDGKKEYRGCICKLKKTCVFKCCPKGQIFVGKECKTPETPFVFDPPHDEEDKSFADISNVFYGTFECPDAEYYHKVNLGSNYSIDKEGYIKYFPHNTYCVDLVQGDNGTEYNFFTCDFTYTPPFNDHLGTATFMISVIFLWTTFAVYAILPELRGCHGKCLMSLTASMALYFFNIFILRITVLHTLDLTTEHFCHLLAVSTYFFGMLFYFWCNAFCIDVFLMFNASSMMDGTKRFICYSAYTWGCAAVMTVFCTVMNYHPDVPNHIKPLFAENICWFSSEVGVLFYLRLPTSFLMLANIILFGLTMHRVLYKKRQSLELTEDYSNNSIRHYGKMKKRLILCLKLSFIMGMNWAFFVMHSFIGNGIIVEILAFINSTGGIIVFVLFVCNQEVWRLLVNRYKSWKYGEQNPRSESNNPSPEEETEVGGGENLEATGDLEDTHLVGEVALEQERKRRNSQEENLKIYV